MQTSKTVSKQARLIAVLAVVFLLMVAVSAPGASSAPNSTFTTTLTAQETMWVDANKCNAEGPRGAWLSFIITNASGVTQNDVSVTFAGFTGTNAAYFKATADPVRQIGTLAANETVAVYFYVDYAEVCNHPQGGGSPYAGYTANYTVTATGSGGTTVYNGTVTTNELLTAAAAGTVTGAVLGPGTVVGQILTQSVTYSFGNNSDLFFQPAAEAGFKDTCLRLVDSKLTAVTGNVTGVTVGDNNRLHFPNASVGGGGGTITITYYWEVRCANTSQTVSPWAAAKSGQKYKYTGIADATQKVTVPAATQSISVSKTAAPVCLPANSTDPVIYTVTFTNSFAGAEVTLNSIADALPSCMTIANPATATSQVTAANSSSIPSVGASGTVNWVGKYRGADPSTTYKIPASGTLTLQFTASIAACPTAATTLYTNQVTGNIGAATVSTTAPFYYPCSPTAVKLGGLAAQAGGDGVLLTWETVAEIDNAGFNVYRAAGGSVEDRPQQEWVKLNAALIPAAAPGSSQGHAYTWIDTTAAPGVTYWYMLEDVALNGATTQHAPVAVTAAEPNALQVAGLGATPGLAPAVSLAALGFALASGFALARRRRR